MFTLEQLQFARRQLMTNQQTDDGFIMFVHPDAAYELRKIGCRLRPVRRVANVRSRARALKWAWHRRTGLDGVF